MDWRIGELWAALIGIWTKKGGRRISAKDFVERMNRRFSPQPAMTAKKIRQTFERLNLANDNRKSGRRSERKPS